MSQHSELFETVRNALWLDGQPEMIYTSAMASANQGALAALRSIEEQFEAVRTMNEDRQHRLEVLLADAREQLEAARDDAEAYHQLYGDQTVARDQYAQLADEYRQRADEHREIADGLRQQCVREHGRADALQEQFESMNRELTATASQLRREGYSALADRIEALTTKGGGVLPAHDPRRSHRASR